jgi:hypothetical protein
MESMRNRVKGLVLGGVSPEKIALSAGLGLALGIIPALGWTTLLCAAAAWTFRLNLPAIQFVNYCAYPLQIALLVPFLRLGSWVFGGAEVALSVGEIVALIQSDIVQAVSELWWATVRALGVWALLSPLLTGAVYCILAPVLRTMERKWKGY